MPGPTPQSLLQELLDPLIDDFRYWFERSADLLENKPLNFLSPSDRADLLARVRTAQSELQSAELLYNLSDNKVGIDPKLVLQWNRLLLDCSKVGQRYRQLNQSAEPDSAT